MDSMEHENHIKKHKINARPTTREGGLIDTYQED